MYEAPITPWILARLTKRGEVRTPHVWIDCGAPLAEPLHPEYARSAQAPRTLEISRSAFLSYGVVDSTSTPRHASPTPCPRPETSREHSAFALRRIYDVASAQLLGRSWGIAKGDAESRTGSEAGRVRARDTRYEGRPGLACGRRYPRLRARSYPRSCVPIWAARLAHSFRLCGLSIHTALNGQRQRPGVWHNRDESSEGRKRRGDADAEEKRPYRA